MKKTVMKWALCSKGGFFTQLTPAMMADGNAKIVALTTENPMNPKIMVFNSHKEMESIINAVEAALAIPLEDSLAKSRSPFADFVEVRIPRMVKTTLPEPPAEIPVV